MSKLATTRNVVRFRWVRPAIDLSLLLITLFVLIALRNMEIEQQLNHKPKLQIQQSAPVKKTLFLEQQFNTEKDLWQSWINWIDTQQPGSGQCLIETRFTQNKTPFYLLCFGKERASARSNIAPNNNLPDNNLFVVPSLSTATKAEEPTEKISAPTHKVQGWMITRQGQKTFDPVQKKWLP
jgi:hypothetical protein